VCKGGAEAVFAVGLAGGRGLAVKIDDGGSRARRVVTAATLSRLGLDNPVIREQCASPVLGGGEPVGAVRPSPELAAALADSPVGATSCRDQSAARRVGR
jgi:L-asparaginase II